MNNAAVKPIIKYLDIFPTVHVINAPCTDLVNSSLKAARKIPQMMQKGRKKLSYIKHFMRAFKNYHINFSETSWKTHEDFCT